MKRWIGACRRSERGASLIETALVLPLLLLLVGGIVDLGGAFNSYIIVTNAAREGARYGSRFPYYGEGIRGAAKQEATNFGVTLSDGDIDIDPDPSTPAASGTPIRVSVTYSYTTLLGGIIGSDTLTLVSSTEMIVFGLD